MPSPLELDRVPADANAEAEIAVGHQVELGRLLRHDNGLPLRQDDHVRHEPQLRGDPGQVREQHHRLVDDGVVPVRPIPAGIGGRIGAEDVISGNQVLVAEILGRLGKGAHAAEVGAVEELCLREHDPYLHRRSPTIGHSEE
jgi:hypothetical protein